MSAKWRQVQAWDNEHLRGPVLAPFRLLLRALSSITLAVTLLSFVTLYGIIASVPVGLLALVPTLAVKAAIACLVLAVLGLLLAGPVVLLARRRGPAWWKAPGVVLAVLAAIIAAVVLTAFIWQQWLWPRLMFDPANGRGLRFFAPFVEKYYAITARRLPGIEMSELEFYAWWPLRVVLLLFVVNMVVTTIRRIEFTFKNIGVLTVHTGIVMLSLGSVYYSGLKREGDTILLAGQPDEVTGEMRAGQPQSVFFDNTRVALYIDAGFGWEQRPLVGLPRYNDYNLHVAGGESAWETAGRLAPWNLPGHVQRPLNFKVVGGDPTIDSGLTFRIVGYCAFANPEKDQIRQPQDPLNPTGQSPLRIVYLHSQLPDDQGRVSDDPVLAFTLGPRSPADRLSEQQGGFALEYTAGPAMGMSDARWDDLTHEVPGGTEYALVVEVPGANSFREVYPVNVGAIIDVGSTGYRLEVKSISPTPPFPIITEGYKGASSSVAQVVVTSPPASTLDTQSGESFERYVYHRFSEINQDMLAELNPRGMPNRRDADPAIRIALIDASQLNVYIDDHSTPAGATVTRAIIRERGGRLRVIPDVGPAGRLEQVVEKISLRIGQRWENSRQVVRPAPASQEEIRRDRDAVGTHEKAMIAVEVSGKDSAGAEHTELVWLSFTKFFGLGPDVERKLKVAGKDVSLTFGRVQHQLPGFAIQLMDFKMLTYDHRGAPRDYQSLVRVRPTEANFETFEHTTQLNAPLTAPYIWDDKRSWPINALGRIRAGLNPGQFKFAQAGWDAAGWARSQKQVDAGEIKKPIVAFTILGVGNSPGVHIVALGGLLMGLGIPWAFYVKPWLVRREKVRIQQALAAGTYTPPAPPRQRTAPSLSSGIQP